MFPKDRAEQAQHPGRGLEILGNDARRPREQPFPMIEGLVGIGRSGNSANSMGRIAANSRRVCSPAMLNIGIASAGCVTPWG